MNKRLLISSAYRHSQRDYAVSTSCTLLVTSYKHSSKVLFHIKTLFPASFVMVVRTFFCLIGSSGVRFCYSATKNSSMRKIYGSLEEGQGFPASCLLESWQGVTKCLSQCCWPAKVSGAHMRKTMRTLYEELDCFPSWVTK